MALNESDSASQTYTFDYFLLNQILGEKISQQSTLV